MNSDFLARNISIGGNQRKIVLSISSTYGWVAGMSLLGVGTALVYATLLAAISDVAHPEWRAT
jgi:hypothetical protein